ncbi:2-hydroxycarboxylate transporter family protein [Nocardia otitidiscaviarum]|uniref:2-hydroxycarboxylate transporter family protein n=1 Tax=Nocardia otitidiscaviarum TaxID=1823 RepID=A0A516NJJ5_9NOCA|nr:2-hydroxycarboxylate transporter family protein [Nocardia otitidiscaviarum]MCP9625068.1 2-hydroxycarboxylate transporter family protein [Nocardia otitidiscaviarum]QDP79080.1 2-hydroxycarboxylate transporter family protein [Nocardia otitidiscaviarum]
MSLTDRTGRTLRRGLPRLDGVPLLVPVALTTVVVVAGAFDAVPENMIGGLAVIVGLGTLLGPLGNRLPVISRIGGGALVCLMGPSILVYLGAFEQNTLDAVTVLMKHANWLYFVISTLVVGSILGMSRQLMVGGLVRIFPPLIAGTAVAVAAGLGTAMAFGYDFHRALFYIVVPIIGGGIGEGVIPLSSAYASALGGEPGSYVAELIPAAIIGNIIAIITAGALRRLGDRRPALDGGGQLVKSPDAALVTRPPEVSDREPNYAFGVLTITGLFVFATLLEHVVHLPAPVLVIVLSVLCKLFGVFPAVAETDARAVYSIISRHFIYPTMVGLGMLYLPLASVMGVLSPGYVLACAAVVLTMAATGFVVGRVIAMYPIDAALVTVCHSGLGGTGDVAILSASQRMNLMPFAQISTRIGGVSTVISAAWLIRVIPH